MKSLEVTPTIVALRNRVEDIKRAEVEKVLGRLGHLSAQDRELVEGLASSIVNKLIHRTMVTLKNEVNSSSGPAFVEAARQFYSLDQPTTPSGQPRASYSESSRYLTDGRAPSETDEPTREPSVPKRAR
jgi:Glutamyl-tRNA reductase